MDILKIKFNKHKKVNILMYSIYYSILNDENNDMNKSLSRKLLYYECEILPYDLYVNKTFYEKYILYQN